ncbi:hypothetical protein [Rathayibacter tanaceti]|uniref:AbiEi antitoxin C-terminal domain-containing protein n=2 Tax=Rathayibacter tanaceti TaxID=1671680 RepID=A0A162GQN5_9MICO|nr:hypothetical protein [Rathayibacter tanaceti]KZX21268.1 hypothetical protein ACH61_01592 [Rathayibacter tanaceti]QHC55357.1 hypothetical protein GSU10_06735 [Rathayibacter tanaceti]TCO36340.1 hypothetical protein EV639_10715 [Rathayibacter tanaceti]
MRLPSVLVPGDLPLAELCAARLDGELIAVDEGFLLADLPLGAAERAASLAALLPRGVVADRLSAAWVHGALLVPPRMHSAAIDRRKRLRPPATTRLRCHEVLLGDGDVVVLSGTSVTTPVRTLIDLARTEEDPRTLRALSRASRTGLDRLLDRLASGPTIAGRRIVERRLRTALESAPPGDQPAFTR